MKSPQGKPVRYSYTNEDPIKMASNEYVPPTRTNTANEIKRFEFLVSLLLQMQ